MDLLQVSQKMSENGTSAVLEELPGIMKNQPTGTRTGRERPTGSELSTYSL